MRHINAIQKLLEDGELNEARTALDNLLELGPGNLDALKIKAQMFSSEGKFKDEEKIWLRILELSNDDEEAIDYIQQRQIDHYFTDDLPGGGKRFVAYPRTQLKISLLGLVGCILFLLFARYNAQSARDIPLIELLIPFAILVILPWIALIYTWVRSLKNITISHNGIEIAARFRKIQYSWTDIEKIYLIHSATPIEPDLRMLLLPKSGSVSRPVCLDLNEDSTSIRARAFLINEIASHNPNIVYVPDQDVNVKQFAPVFY